MLLFHFLKSPYRDDFTLSDLIKLKVSKSSPEVVDATSIAESERRQSIVVNEVQ